MSKRPFSPAEFREIYSKVPRATVNLVVKLRGALVLALRNLPSWKNQWHLPGGTILYDETVKDTVDRVAKEELGIEVRIVKPLGYIEYPSEKKERGFGRTIGITILCEALSDELAANDEATEIQAFQQLPDNVISEERTFLIDHWEDIFTAS